MAEKITIKSWVTGGVLFETTATDLRAALEKAVSERAYLGGAYLRGAKLGGADLRGAKLGGADLRGAKLGGADLSSAYLRGAKLGGADLSSAYLGDADLRGAKLGGADLSSAYLRGAKLGGAKGLDAWRVTPLLMLLDQPGPIRAYKLVNANMEGPFNGGVKYAIGEVAEVADANTNVNDDCGAGINLATFDWVAQNWQPGFRILIAEFTAADIAAIPTASDGKFRVHRCTIVGEITDLAARGLGQAVAS